MRYFTFATTALVLLWITVGCSPPQTTGPSITTTSEGQETKGPVGIKAAQDAKALVRFINADSNEKSLEIWVGDSKVFSDVAFKESTPFKELPAASNILFQLQEHGKTDQLAANRRLLLFGRHYTLVALPQEKHSSRLAIMSDNMGYLEPGDTRVRLVNATPDVDNLDLYIAGTQTRVLHDVDSSMVTAYADVPSTTLEIRVENRPARPQLSNLKLEPDNLFTFIVVGKATALDVFRIADHIDQ